MKFNRGSQILHQRTVAITMTGTTVDININKDLTIQTQEVVTIEVAFTEALTEKVTSASTQINIMNFPYSVVFAGDSSFFVPNTVFNFKFSLRKFDGTSVIIWMHDFLKRI